MHRQTAVLASVRQVAVRRYLPLLLAGCRLHYRAASSCAGGAGGPIAMRLERGPGMAGDTPPSRPTGAEGCGGGAVAGGGRVATGARAVVAASGNPRIVKQ